MTVTGQTLGENLDWWEQSERRTLLKERLKASDGIDADQVIMSPDTAAKAGLAATLVFPKGNLAPEGAVIKATAIDSKLCPGNVFRGRFRARVFVTEGAAIRAIKSTGADRIRPGEVIVILCQGPDAACMPEQFQATSAAKYTADLTGTPIITDGRFSGVSTGPCIGHIGPEAIAGGPIGKLQDGDLIEIVIDRNTLEGTLNIVGEAGTDEIQGSMGLGDAILSQRSPREDLATQPELGDDHMLFSALQSGTWTGAVYDAKEIRASLRVGRAKRAAH
jgi:dihydroxyacid dehydratase/phosphogluconate dehydratase